ncbi:hypothetical protein PCE1_004645 [Barthelona sp. PCE]
MSFDHWNTLDTSFMRQKQRRNSSMNKRPTGDHLNLRAQKKIQDILRDNREASTSVLFSDLCIKVNRKNASQNRLVLLSPQNLYNLHPVSFKVLRKISLESISLVSLSTLTDNFFVIHCNSEYDYLLSCGKKTELIALLRRSYKLLTGVELEVRFADSFEMKLKTGQVKTVLFEPYETAEGPGVLTQIFSADR